MPTARPGFQEGVPKGKQCQDMQQEVAAIKKHALTGTKPTGASLSHLLVRNHSHVLLDEFLDLSTGDYVFGILDRALLKLVVQAWRTE